MNAFRCFRFPAWLAVVFAVVLLDGTLQAQGMFNANNNYTPTGATGRAFITDATGQPASRTTTRVAFLGPDFNYITAGGPAGIALVANGLFFINGVTVPGVPIGGTAQIIVQAWDSSTGATYDAALVRASVTVTVQPLGGGQTPPATFALNSNFTGLSLGWGPPPPFQIEVEGGTATLIRAEWAESIIIPSTISGYTVTRIAPQTFLNRTEITQLVLPSTLVEIGSDAFAGCSGIRQVILPPQLTTLGERAFARCTALEQVTLPASLATIPREAFADCPGLLEIEVPDAVAEIGPRAFQNCERLQRMELPPFLLLLGDECLAGCAALTELTLPDGLYRLGRGALMNCKRLERLVLPPSLTELEENVLAGCSNLPELILPGTLQRIDTRALLNCSNLTDLELPLGVLSLGNESLAGTALASLWIPESVVTVGQDVLRDTRQLESVHVDPSNTAFYSLDGVLLKRSPARVLHYPARKGGSFAIPDGVAAVETGVFTGRQGLTGIRFPGSVTQIAPRAFEGCSLVDLAFPEGVVSIGARAFADNRQCRSVRLPASLVNLGPGAFAGCDVLFQVELPSRLTLLEAETFKDCRSLTQVYLPSGIRALGNEAFRNCVSLSTLQLPETVEELGSDVFAGAIALRSVRFAGPPPRVAGPLGLPADAVIAFLPIHPGWGETFEGLPTQAWLPSLQIGSETAGGGSLRMTVDWAEGQTVVLEGLESLGSTNWSPLSTHRLPRQPLELTVPIGETAASRFFRVSPAAPPTESPDPQAPR